VRDFEHALGVARALPFVDAARIGVLGVNFDGMPALLFQMKHMVARAVASVDGWEGKRGNVDAVRGSPFFDPRRMRGGYLLVLQDEPDAPPALAHAHDVAEALRYADRRVLVVRGLRHAHLVADPYAVGRISPAARAAFAGVVAAVVALFDRHLRARAGDPPAIERASLDRRLPALPPVPIAAEVERMVLDGPGPSTLARLQREARARDSTAVLVSEGQLRLLAFRLRARDAPAAVVELWEAGVEAHPTWVAARRELALAHAAVGDTARAIRTLEDARDIVDRDPRVPSEQRTQVRGELAELVARWKR
jgi:hypothetical protein